MALKKALYNADLFITENRKPTHRDSRTNTSDIIDYIISSPVIFNNIQNITRNNDLFSDHSAILFDFWANINISTLLPIKVKLYHKTDWDSINSLLSKQLDILQYQIFNLRSSNNSSVIRQKGESQNGCFKKTKHAKFSEKTNISNPLIRTRKIWRALFSWNTRFEIRHFALLPTNSDPINIINNAAIILSDFIRNIHNNLQKKTIKPNTSVPFSI